MIDNTPFRLMHFPFPKGVLYLGPGRAWGAVDDCGNLVDVIYMDGRGERWETPDVPEWVLAIRACTALTPDNKFVYWTTRQLVEIHRMTDGMPGLPTESNGSPLRPSSLVGVASKVWAKAENKLFSQHRERSREYLATLGAVIGGMCDKSQFSTY